MRFAILGPIEVSDADGAALRPPAGRARTVLALLCLNPGRVVSRDRLIDLAWNGAPPASATTRLHGFVSELRRALPAGPEPVIRTVGRGYSLAVADDRIDLHQARRLVAGARAHWQQGDAASAARCLGDALALWRGPAFEGIECAHLQAEADAIEQEHADALEELAELQLALGQHTALVPGLGELVARYPLREGLRASLMRALAGSGRQAEAIDTYHDLRRRLADELGVDPAPQVRELYTSILDGDRELLAPRPAQAVPSPQPTRPSAAQPPATPVPRQLPAAAGHFTGRSGELAWLTGLVDRSGSADGGAGAVVISAIDGMAGIGKTTLAVHAAHRLAERFPGGQLFLDLRGYTGGYQPREPDGALEWLLRALGVPAEQIPEDTDARAALYRQRLADTRTLIVLDNAIDEAQVRPLLPGAPGCLVLITSRRRLKGLDDAYNLPLELLAPPDAAALLRAVAGAERIPADDPLLAKVAELCGYLPLALRIAGALLRHRPAWNLQHLAGLLREPQRRVAALSDGDRDLAAVFDLSYTGLPERHRLLLRRLGLAPGPDADAYAAAALLDTDPQAATGLLEDLVDHNLLIAQSPGRYRLHDLIRAHAHSLSEQDPAKDRDAALDRLLHYYAHTAQSASISVALYSRPKPDDPTPAHPPAVSDPEAARAWLRAERDNLESASAHARACALPEHALALAAGLAEILRADGPVARAVELHQAAADTAARQGYPAAHALALTDLGLVRRQTGDLPGAGEALNRALEICRAIGDRHAEAAALTHLGGLRRQTGDLTGAGEALSLALEIYREIGDRHGEAAALTDLGGVRRLMMNLAGAGEAMTRALEIYREIGHLYGEAVALSGLGQVRRNVGELPGAVKVLTRAFEIYRDIGHRRGEANILNELGAVRRLVGDLTGADEALTRALEIYREIGHLYGEAYALTELGGVRRRQGDVSGAAEALTRALAIYRATGNRGNEAWALNQYADTVAAGDDVPRALTLYRQALEMNRELNKPDDEAIALEGLGQCHLTVGEAETGTVRLREALEIYQRLGMTRDAERVRAQLTDLPTS